MSKFTVMYKSTNSMYLNVEEKMLWYMLELWQAIYTEQN